MKFQANLKRQLELIRMNTRPPPVSVSVAPPVSTQSQMPFNRQNSNTSTTTANEDGWVLVSSQNESDAWSMKCFICSKPNLTCNIYNNRMNKMDIRSSVMSAIELVLNTLIASTVHKSTNIIEDMCDKKKLLWQKTNLLVKTC